MKELNEMTTQEFLEYMKYSIRQGASDYQLMQDLEKFRCS